MASVDSASIAQLPNATPQRRLRRGGHNSLARRSGQNLGSVTETNGSTPRPINSSLALRPASVAPSPNPSSAEPSSAEASANENGQSGNARRRGPRGRGRARATARGGEARGGEGSAGGSGTNPNEYRHGHHGLHSGSNRGTVLGSSRQLGERLTQEEPTSLTQTISTLQADAPEFYPGQQHQQRPINTRGGKAAQPNPRQPQAKAPRARRQSIPKSTARDIATRTHEDIANGVYECPICTNGVARNSKVWSCKTCWTVFHLSCIKKWSTNEGSTQAQRRNENGDLPSPRQWRCPGCNLPKDDLPSTYTCWCAKESDPQPVSGIPPHSCGQTCSNNRILPRKCPHPCEQPCHAGPCPPCSHMGPLQSCFCGKKSISRRCVDTNYDSGWSCGEVCGDPLPCPGEHTCQKLCHEGLCGSCEIKIDSRCYCGKDERTMVCSERSDEKPSKRALEASDDSTNVEEWTGTFDCGNGCQRQYDCGKHACKKNCHPQELNTPHCPRSPDLVHNCPCGKTSLNDVSSTPRETCEDPIPNCDKKCLKILPCGHSCLETCHADDCMPCLMTVSILCRCGRTQSSTVCHQGKEEQPRCMRACRATLNCGRHECGERCCSGGKKAAERQATKRKLRPLGSSRIFDEGFEAEHICTRSCGRMLKCGNHLCPELCHKGPCGSCREAIFDELSCFCGKTVLQPPLPCGTSPPPCRFDCERPRDCGHPRVQHSCHGDEEPCPKCPFLAQKPCLCGKKTLKNQPCWLSEVHCGESCKKKLKCGSHSCRKQCHRPGECEDVGKSCQQICGKAKKACNHPCTDICHAPSSCREDKCQNKMFITCECQHLKQEVKCNASKTSEGNTKKSLECDDECARLARNHKLALALNIDPEAHKDDHIPYSNDTLKMFRENVKWGQTQEREIRVFAADETEKRLRFRPMPSHQRAFIHSLSEDFGFDSESMDPDPYRHVAVFKTPRFVMAPMKTLAECIRIRTSAEASIAPKAETSKKLQANNEIYNGFLLSNPRFGLTLDELRSDCAACLDSTPGLSYDISFLPSEEIVIKARPASSWTVISSSAIEASIKALKARLSASISSKHLATSIQLCALDHSLNITRREMDDPANNGGWSQVAAKAAAPRTAPRQGAVGERSVYTVLGSKLRDAKKKKAKESEVVVVDDWEEEMRRQEEAEEKAATHAQNHTDAEEGAHDGALVLRVKEAKAGDETDAEIDKLTKEKMQDQDQDQAAKGSRAPLSADATR